MINRQTRKSNCGPTATYNALKWLGRKVKYSDVYNIAAKEGYFRPDSGMRVRDVKHLLLRLGVKPVVRRKPRMSDIDRELEAGNAIIFKYEHTSSGHFVFIERKTAKYYKVWNDSRYNTTPYRRRKSIAKWVRYSHQYCYDRPTMLILKKF